MSIVSHHMPDPVPEVNGGSTAMPRYRRPRGRVVAAATTLAMAAVTLGAVSGTSAQAAAKPVNNPTGSVIVYDCANPAAATRAAGGMVTADLPLIRGVAGELPAGAQLSGCLVVANRAMQVSGKPSGDDSAAPVSTVRQTLGLTPSSPTGDGVTVAQVDTGVDDSADLKGRVIHADVTLSSFNSTHDDYGHGTFMAGLIAGNGKASKGAYQGAAPDARILDVRVARDDGSTSLASVLRGLQVVKSSQYALNIRVLNLSLASESPVPYQFDPLTLALEGLWGSGIVVVVPAGNDGPAAGTVSSPGLDPTLLTVGSLDEATTASRADDTVSSYSSRGPAAQGVAKPDLVAPGAHLISLRAPGSVIDAQNPDSRIADHYFRGSGTSMATALTSGVAADLISARPDLTPDQVKAILASSAYTAPGLTDPAAAGAGGLDLTAALATAKPTINVTDDWPTGQNEIFTKFSNALLSGDRTAASYYWNQLSPEARSWVARSWVSLSPEARSWVARSWVSYAWAGADGSAAEWLARSWVARSWVARSWVARSWVARSWVALDWNARSWVNDDWAARSWVARSWVARSWVTQDWS